jgi:excisionase family DNA binding protein
MRTDVCLSGDRLALRMRELAKAVNLSIRTVWGLTKAGVIPHVRVGGSILYPVDSIRQWLQQQAKGQQETAQAQASGEPAPKG